MIRVAYHYIKIQPDRYFFVSEGQKKIAKVVEFVPTNIDHLVSIAFGDLLPDNSIDYHANSNNGDMIRVLFTVVDIVTMHTLENPVMEIYFEGSTERRTRLYARMLRIYYLIFSEKFVIEGVIKDENKLSSNPYDPHADVEYLGFVIKRKS